MIKKYKCYFNKNDSPFRQDYQENRPMHTCWHRMPYTKFLNHKVVKIKLFGLITIYDELKEKNNAKQNKRS